MQRKNIASGSPWEARYGYSRAVRIGNTIHIGGTVANDGETKIGIGDPYRQAKHILQKMERLLKAEGASMKDVIQTRMYVVDISLHDEVGRAHAEFFKDVMPVATMVEVAGLIDPDFLVEIEAVAVLED